MEGELDLAAAAAAGGLFARGRHAPLPGAVCRNCGTALRGPWCDQCGQLGEDFHRSASHLAGEAFEGFFHADGRVFSTLPRLARHPGALTRDYVDGKRAPQIPPFRLFLTMLLILFVVGSIIPPKPRVITSGPREDAALAQVKTEFREDLKSAGDFLMLPASLKIKLPLVIDSPGSLLAAMGEWAHRFAFLTLPVSAGLLAIIFVTRRDVYFFDHLVFSMHSLSFQGLLVAFAMAFDGITKGAVATLLVFACPIHLYIHMRGFYGTGKLTTLLSMAVLFVTSSFVFSLLLLVLVLIGLNGMTACPPVP